MNSFPSLHPALHLARVFFKMFLRDRQAIFFSLFFPIIFLSILGFMNARDPDPVDISVAKGAARQAKGLGGDGVS